MMVGKVVSGSWRHKKRGSTYVVMSPALLQTDKPITDMEPLVVYMAEDGTMWVRPRDEFLDGRFEEVKPDIADYVGKVFGGPGVIS